MEINRKRQDSTPGPAERFTGAVWFDEIGATEHTTVMSVHFPPGARTAWHSHPQGQVLHVTDGAGLVQSRGGDREERCEVRLHERRSAKRFAKRYASPGQRAER